MAIQLSGSLEISGSINATGGITVSGSIASASYAATATSASFASNASLFSNRDVNSFATTASNAFSGSQVVSGSLTVTGQVIAQTLNVQAVTSSIVYSSGSNVFGNSVANTQQFTGSLQVSGSNHSILGNVGIGVTPSAWSLRTGLQITGDGYIVSSNPNLLLGANVFFDGSNRSYITTGVATDYRQIGGEHRWETAPSGTANTAPIFTTRMSLTDALLTVSVPLNGTSAAFSGGGTFGGVIDVVSATGTYSTFRTNDATSGINAGGGFYNVASATPASRLAAIWLDADGANFAGSDYGIVEKVGGGGKVRIMNYNNTGIAFGTAGTEYVTINGTTGALGGTSLSMSGAGSFLGSLGVGTASPTRILHLSASGVSSAIRLDNTFSGRPFLLTYDDSQNLTFINSSDVGNTDFNSGTGTSTTKVRITNSGNTLIKTTTDNGTDALQELVFYLAN